MEEKKLVVRYDDGEGIKEVVTISGIDVVDDEWVLFYDAKVGEEWNIPLSWLRGVFLTTN